jgi:excisionase family DNA binding protein
MAQASTKHVIPKALRRSVVSGELGSNEGKLSISEAAELLDVTRATVHEWIESTRLLAWPPTHRGMRIPAEQIVGAGEVVPGIERVLAVIGEPEAAWDFLNEKSAFVDPQEQVRPMDALKHGQPDAVMAAAHSFLEAFS